MGRYYFDLHGAQNTRDLGGLSFEDDLETFQAAKRLAAELAAVRPNLKGNTCVVLTRQGANDVY